MVLVQPRHRYRREPASAANLLPRWRDSAPRTQQVDLAAAWLELGAPGAGAIPIRCSRNGVVTVACTDAARAQEISAQSDDFLASLARLAGASLTGLRVVVADHAVNIPSFGLPDTQPASAAATRAAREAAEGITTDIEDEQLRDAIMRAAAAALARQWDKTST
jgi:hypothetical protein